MVDYCVDWGLEMQVPAGAVGFRCPWWKPGRKPQGKSCRSPDHTGGENGNGLAVTASHINAAWCDRQAAVVGRSESVRWSAPPIQLSRTKASQSLGLSNTTSFTDGTQANFLC